MSIKFDKIEPGMILLDIHSYRMGNSTMRELGLWRVRIISVDKETQTAMVSWNGNPPKKWYRFELEKLYVKETNKYREQQERKRQHGRY
jgi:hypothetical protein